MIINDEIRAYTAIIIYGKYNIIHGNTDIESVQMQITVKLIP